MIARPRLAAAAALVLAIAVATGTSHAHPGHGDEDPLLGDSTLEHTILGEDQDEVNDPRGDPESFALLRIGPGEPYVVREELADALPGRESRRVSLIYLGHLTDFQIADSQSPGRVELLDPLGGPVSAAWRPQEALVPHQVEFSVRQINRLVQSPVPEGDGAHARMENAVMTGDLADNQQLNETRWVKQLMQGGVFVDGTQVSDEIDPNSGSSDVSTYPPECQAAVQLGLLDPDDAERYVGVQNYDDFPGGSTLADKHNFYDPNQPAGLYENWPVYEGLMDKAQEPFEAEGLEVPFYVAFGNHDMLVQGNQWANSAFDLIVQGCVKAYPAPSAESLLEDILGGAIGSGDEGLLSTVLGLVGQPGTGELPILRSFEAFVPPDGERRFIDRREFKQVFDNGFQDDAHGFAHVDDDELAASDGAASYYDFSPVEGIRYIVLDTVSYGGQFPLSSSGNIDHPQFQWLERKLALAQERGELILVFAHHATGSLDSPVPHEIVPPCRDPVTGADLQEVIGPGCDRDPRSSSKPGELSPHQGEDLRDLLLAYPNVIALIAGHSHNNQVQPFSDGQGGGFWEVKSPAVVDWPAQHRLVELMDNGDGTLSIFGTMLDDASPPRSPTPEDGEEANSPRFEFERDEVEGFTPEDLSSIGRTLSYNDPQVGPGRGGIGPQGIETDRNVELLIGDPRLDDEDDTPANGDPDGDRPRDERGERAPDRDRDRGLAGEGAGAAPGPDPVRGATAASPDDPAGALPFTGMLVSGLLLLAGLLLAAGRLARRLSKRAG